MEKKKPRSNDKIPLLQLNSDLLLTFLPIKKIDEIIMNECFRLDLHQAPEDDLEASSEESELTKIHRFTTNIRTQDSLNQILQMLKKTSYPIIKLKICDFFMDFLLRPVQKLTRPAVTQNPISNINHSTLSLQQEKEKSDLENEFVLVLENLSRAFPFFPEQSKNEILNTLARALIILSPDKNQVRESTVPSFQSYSAVFSACTNIVEHYDQPGFPKQHIIHFIHSILSYFVSIAIKLTTAVRFTHTNLSSYYGYIGEFLPFVASLEPIIKDDPEDMIKLLCQFWVTFVIFSISNFNSFIFQFGDAIEKIVAFLPPLISKPTKFDFSRMKYKIQELIQLIKPPLLGRIDDIIPSFQKAIPNINVKLLYNLEFIDLVLAYSIFLLESVRAGYGIFGPIFSYFEIEFYSNFTLVLDPIFDAVFDIFMKKLSTINDPTKKAVLSRHTMAILIQNYTNPNLKIQSLVDQCFKQFTSSFNSLMFDKLVLQILANSERPLRSVSPQRQIAFNEVIQSLFEKSTIIAPYAFLALLQNLVLSSTHDNFVKMLPSFVIPVSQFLPIEYRETFITEFAVKAIAHGQAKFASKEHLLSIPDPNDRLLVISAYIVQTSDISLIPELVTYAPQHSLLLAWSNVIMCSSDEVANSLIRQLFIIMIRMAKDRRGIFYDSDRYYDNTNLNNDGEKPKQDVDFSSILLNDNTNFNEISQNINTNSNLSVNYTINSSSSYTSFNSFFNNSHISNFNSSFNNNYYNNLNSNSNNSNNFNNFNNFNNMNGKREPPIRGSVGPFKIFSGSKASNNYTDQNATRKSFLYYNNYNNVKANNNINQTKNVLFLPIDLEKEIKIQTAIARFLIELFSLAKFYQSQLETLVAITETPLYNHPSILPVIIPLAFLICGCLAHSEHMETKIIIKFAKFIFRLSFLAFSFKGHAEVFHYISAPELYYLDQLITIFPIISKILQTSNGTEQTNQETNEYTRPSTFNSFQFPNEFNDMRSILNPISNADPYKNPTNFKILRDISAFASIIRKKTSKIDSLLQSNYASLFNLATVQLTELYSLAVIYRKDPIPQSFTRLVHTPKSSTFHFSKIIPLIFDIVPESLYSISFFFRVSNAIQFLSKLINSNLIDLAVVPDLSYLALDHISLNDDKLDLPFNYLLFWKPLDFINSLRFLKAKDLPKFPASTTFYITRCLDRMDENTLILFIPVFVQSLLYDQTNQIFLFLQKHSRLSHSFAIYLLLHILSLDLATPNQLLQLEETSQSTDYLQCTLISNNSQSNTSKTNQTKECLPLIQKLTQSIFQSFKNEEREQFHHELAFFSSIDIISQRLFDLDPADRSNYFSDSITSLRIADDLFNPLNPSDHIASIDCEHSICLNGFSQMPLLFCFSLSSFSVNHEELESNSQDFNFTKTTSHFETLETSSDSEPNQNIINEEEDEEDEDSHHIIITQDYNELDDHEIFMTKNAACVFRSFFNIRNDALSMEILWILKNAWQKANLDVFVHPYLVFPTGVNRGITELLSAKSRHEIGRATNEKLLTYFIGKYGNIGSPEFIIAQNNFMKSLAPYSFFCYLIQAKDRHNANILLDDEGHILHINFGNILGYQEKMTLERAPFKLTHEMIMLLGGSQDNPVFQKFVKLFAQCFLAARLVHHEIETIVSLMADYGGFKEDALKRLNQRFHLDKSPKDIASTVEKLIEESYEAKSTLAFDGLMAGQNNIFF